MHIRIVQNRKSSYADTVRIVSPRGNVSYDVQIIKIGPLMQAGCSHKNKVKRKKSAKKPKREKSRVHSDHPRCCSFTSICMCGHAHNIVTYSIFYRSMFRGFMANAGALKVAYCHYFSYWLFQQLLLTYKPWFTLGLCSICSVQFVHVVCRGLYVQCVWQAVVIQMHLRSTLTPPILMTVHPVSCRHQTPMLRSVFHVPLCFDLVIIGSLTQCRRASIVLLSGVCRRPSSVTLHGSAYET